MAFTKCGKCEGTFFEIKEKEPSGSAYKIMFVQCKSCGTPFGITEYFNSGALIKEQEKAIAQLSAKVDNLDYLLRQIASRLR